MLDKHILLKIKIQVDKQINMFSISPDLTLRNVEFIRLDVVILIPLFVCKFSIVIIVFFIYKREKCIFCDVC